MGRQDGKEFYSALWDYARLQDGSRLPAPEEIGFRSKLRAAFVRHLGFAGPVFRLETLDLPPRGLAVHFGCPADGQADIIPASAYKTVAASLRANTPVDIIVSTSDSIFSGPCRTILNALPRILQSSRIRLGTARVRLGMLPSHALAALALAKHVLCSPEDPAQALCFWAAIGGFQGTVSTSKRFFNAIRPELPPHVRWASEGPVLLAQDAAKMPPQDVLAWITSH